MKKYKVIRRFPMDEPVIEASYDTREEAEEHADKAREQENRMGLGMKAKYTIETGDLPYEVE